MDGLLIALQENVFKVAKNYQVKHKHLQMIPQIHVFKNVQMSLTTSLKMSLLLVSILVHHLLQCSQTTQQELVFWIALKETFLLLLILFQDSV